LTGAWGNVRAPVSVDALVVTVIPIIGPMMTFTFPWSRWRRSWFGAIPPVALADDHLAIRYLAAARPAMR
jgi:hypothetical protein